MKSNLLTIERAFSSAAALLLGAFCGHFAVCTCLAPATNYVCLVVIGRLWKHFTWRWKPFLFFMSVSNRGSYVKLQNYSVQRMRWNRKFDFDRAIIKGTLRGKGRCFPSVSRYPFDEFPSTISRSYSTRATNGRSLVAIGLDTGHITLKENVYLRPSSCSTLTFWRRNFLLNFLIFKFKMWIIQEPKKVALWNKRYFEERETEIMQHV
jgi:hypothetical protein